jgi:hypothetical protein
MMTESQKAVAAFKIVHAVAEAVRELKEIPSGHLYARLMGHLSLDQYEQVVALLVRTKLVEKDASHMLRWVGPEVN